MEILADEQGEALLRKSLADAQEAMQHAGQRIAELEAANEKLATLGIRRGKERDQRWADQVAKLEAEVERLHRTTRSPVRAAIEDGTFEALQADRDALKAENAELREAVRKLAEAAAKLLPSAHDIERIRREPHDCFSSGLVALWDALSLPSVRAVMEEQT